MLTVQYLLFCRYIVLPCNIYKQIITNIITPAAEEAGAIFYGGGTFL